MTRCSCLQLEINQRRLGQMYCPDPLLNTPLRIQKGKNLVLNGTLTDVRRHVAGVLLGMAEKNETWLTMDAYRFIEIFLGEDKEHETTAPTIDADLLIILLGFGDPRNRYLPELIVQALNRRDLLSKPTWVILGISQELIQPKYNTELAEKLSTFKPVRVK
jgi:hypothetical protein